MKREITGLLLVIAGFTAYSLWQLYNYTYRLISFKFNAVANDSLSGTIKIAIYNPSPIHANVLSYQFEIYVNGIYTTTLHGNGPYTLKEKAETIIDINFSVRNIPNLAALIGPSIIINKKTMIRFKGPVRIQMFGITKQMNIDIDKPLSWYLT